MSSQAAETRDDEVGSVYTGIKLKKVDKIPKASITATNSDASSIPAYSTVQLKRIASTNTKLPSSNGDEKTFTVQGLKKTKPIVRQTTFESKNSFDSFDSGKLRKIETMKRPVVKDGDKSPTYTSDGLRSTGKVERANSILDDKPTSSSDELWSNVLTKVNSTHVSEVLQQAKVLYSRVQVAGGCDIVQRRLSLSDNDLVTQLVRVTGNDSSTREVIISNDVRFHNIKPDLIVGFAEGLRTNFNLCHLVLSHVGLGNDFLSPLADSMRTNFMLERLDLSHNSFTNDGLVDLCLAMAENDTLLYVNLLGQQSPIFTMREDLAVAALWSNTTVLEFNIEFQTAACDQAVRDTVQRNHSIEVKSSSIDYGKRLLDYLEQEVVIAEKRQQERKMEIVECAVCEDDMPFLFDLSVRAAKYKLPYDTVDDATAPVEPTAPAKSNIKTSMAKITANILNADGSFLTNAFMSQFIFRDKDEGSLTFDFSNQVHVFKRFAVTDPARAVIVKKFVDVLVEHPQAGDITHVSMVNTLIGNDWLVYLCHRCINDSSLFPNLHLLNLETNFISGAGVTALANCIAAIETWKYLQAVKLDNQKQMISSEAEDNLARAMCTNHSIIKLSLRVRNMFERRRINTYLTRNIDFLRQARRWQAVLTGTVKERPRNKLEHLFDRIAANDASVTTVELVADPVFTTLHPKEVIKAAKSFAGNTHVTTVKLSGLRLDDAFALAMAQSLLENTVLTKLDLETNMIGTQGMIALVMSLSTNRSVTALLLRHQSKSLSSTDEERIPALIAENDVILKLSVDVRGTMTNHCLARKLRENQEQKRRRETATAPANRGTTHPHLRNRVQTLFDRVAANDASITAIHVVSDPVFRSLHPTEIIRTAQSLAFNTHVTRVKVSGVGLDDAWALALVQSLRTNRTIATLDLEANAIGSEGLLALVGALSCNDDGDESGSSICNGVTEMLLRHQSKAMTSVDEELIPGLIAENVRIVKLSLDVRGTNAKCSIDRTIRRNQELRRQNRITPSNPRPTE